MPFKNFHIVGLSFLVLIFLLVLPASSASLDFTDSVIVTPPKLERLEQKAVTVLREEIQKRTGIQLSVLTEWPKNQQSIIAVGQTGQMKILAGPYSGILEKGRTPGKEGFRLLIKDAVIFVAGHGPRGG